MGAAKGMMKLRLLWQCEIRELGEEEVSQAFGDAYQFLDNSLLEEQKDAMGWDAGMLEHTMCKYSKMNPLNAKDNVDSDDDSNDDDV